MTNPLEPIEDDERYDAESFDGSEDAQAEDTAEEFSDWGGGELEQAYLKAMLALEASEAEMPDDLPVPAAVAEIELPVPSAASIETRPIVVRPSTGGTPATDPTNSSLAELYSNPSQAFSTGTTEKSTQTSEGRPTPRQIVEACLFVGGSALTSKKLSGILRGDFDSEFVDREIDELNRLYAAENRPYEIRLGEGGYRLALREEFERIRHKVYGLGPKEVRLSQEALEVLAVVAYHQPIKQSSVEEMGKPACGAVLRQLVRRELLAVERHPEHPRDVNYKTTPRFLSLFGIRNLDELPRHEQVSYK